MVNLMKHHDITVIGAGIAGFASCMALKKAGLTPLLISGPPGATALIGGIADADPPPFQNRQTPPPPASEALQTLYQHIETTTQGHLQFAPKYRLLAGVWGSLHWSQLAHPTMLPGDLSFPNAEPTPKIGLANFSHPALDAHPASYYTQKLDEELLFQPIPIPLPPNCTSPTQLARCLESKDAQQQLLEALPGEQIETLDLFLFPPILGIQEHRELLTALQKQTGVPCAEMIATTPSIPGFRLHQALERILEEADIPRINGLVTNFTQDKLRIKSLQVTDPTTKQNTTVETQHIILATGGPAGGGITSRAKLEESVFKLPVIVPTTSSSWEEQTHRHYLHRDARSKQPLFFCGLQSDEKLRPVDTEEYVLLENVTIAGSLVASSKPLAIETLPTNIQALFPHPLPLLNKPTSLSQAFALGELAAHFAIQETT